MTAPSHPVGSALTAEVREAYDSVDRFLRNNLDDTDYAKLSDDLETVLSFSAALVAPEPADTGNPVSESPASQPAEAVSESEQWIAEAKLTLNRLNAFLQMIGAPHAVDWREWIDNAEKHVLALAGTQAAAEHTEGGVGRCAWAAMLAAAPTPEGAVESAKAGLGAVELARMFHDRYETLAPAYGYETRPDTKTFDPHSKNGRLMVAVIRSLRAALATPSTEGAK